MKRKLLYLALCVNFLLGMTGCYEDLSTEATHTIPEIVIDTTGIDATFTLKRFERLQINPKVSKEGTDPSEFSYKWMLSMKPVKFGTQDAYECISEEKDLDAEINRDDDETTYRLWYQVTDNTTGLRKDMIWTIRVLAPYGEGLLVAEEVNGGTDLALIESEEFSDGWEEAPLIRHDIFSTANDGAVIDADIFQLSAFREGSSTYTKYYLTLGEGNDKYLLMNKTYKVVQRNEEAFEAGSVKKVAPTQFIPFAYAFYLVNDGKMHWMFTSPNSTQMKWSPEVPYQGGYVALNMLAGGKYTGTNYSFYYDEANSRLMQLYNTTMRWDLATISVGKVNGINFDPTNCPGIEMIYGGIAPDNRVYGLFKRNDGSYFILCLNGPKQYFDRYYELPACELDNAIAYASCEMGNVLYFATTNKIYAIQLDAAPVSIYEAYSTTEEITHMSIFRQAKNATSSSNATLAGSAQTILVTTWNGTKGTVHYLPIDNGTTGDLNLGEAKKFEGFGKISTVTHQYP